MKLKFLCSCCRESLSKNPSEIPHRGKVGYRLAVDQYQAGLLDESLKSIGTVYEMSEMMFEADCFTNEYAADWVIATSEVFVRVLSEKGEYELSRQVHLRARAVLESQVNVSEMSKFLPKLARIARDSFGVGGRYLSVVQ